MRILITHSNFPAQFRHIAEHMGRTPGNHVVFATKNLRKEWVIPGTNKAIFKPDGTVQNTAYPLTRQPEDAIRNGVGLLSLCKKLKGQGFVPDLILGHSGWGQTMFLHDVFPHTPFIGYFEWYYNATSAESTFYPKQRTELDLAQLRLRNTGMLHDLVECQAGISPTRWQLQQFPKEFHSKIHQIHDGINTRYFAPHENGVIQPEELNIPGVDLSGAKEIVTYTSRGLEPYRGFPQFYAALPAILDARPDSHVLIVGDDRVCYSPRLPNGETYKEQALKQVKLDTQRVHFTGPLPYGEYKQILQASSAHVYLTWPFVLSWSFLEAMACGCLIVGSDTEPVREIMRHEENGLLTDFHSSEAIAQSVITALEQQSQLGELRRAARKTICDSYCLTKSLPAQMALLNQVATQGMAHP